MTVPAWVRRWGPIAFAISVVVYLLVLWHWLRAYTLQIDVAIYRFGGQQLVHGHSLYDVGLHGHPFELLFNYPPFAAAVFAALDPFPIEALRPLSQLVNVALLIVVVARCWQVLGVRARRDLWSVTLLVSAAVLWLEPVRTTIALGQLNIVLLAIVVFDVLPPERWARYRRHQGIGVGLAAGMKLTPLLFIPYLALTRRVDAAKRAALTFIVTVVIGFAVAPSQAWHYWIDGVFDDLRRVAPIDSTGNESIRGMLARLDVPTVLALLVVAAVAVVAVAVAARIDRDGDPVFGVALLGMATAAVSPFSWGYHWVWFVPLAVVVGHGAIVRRRPSCIAAAVVLFAVTAGWIVGHRSPAGGQLPPLGVIAWEEGGWTEHVTRSAYLVVFAAALALAACRPRFGQNGVGGVVPPAVPVSSSS